MNKNNITPNPYKDLTDSHIEACRTSTQQVIDNMLADQADGFSINVELLACLKDQIRLMNIELNENRFLM
jgi:hypothetical protein